MLKLTAEIWLLVSQSIAFLVRICRSTTAVLKRGFSRGSHVLTSGKTHASVVFARAIPQKSAIVETYRFRQISSVNPVLEAAEEEPIGQVEIVVPFDGYRYFTRDAIKDAQGHLGEHRGRGYRQEIMAAIGHLVLTNTRDARRGGGEPIADARGAIRLRVPIRSVDLGDDDLAADEREASLRFDYRPPTLGTYVFPIQLDVEILDPEDSTLLDGEFDANWERAISDEVVRQPAFSSELRMRFRIHLTWPRWGGIRKPRMHIKAFSLSWPTVTSLDPNSLRLYYGEEAVGEIQYNPAIKSLQWFEIPLHGEKGEPETDADAKPQGAEPFNAGSGAEDELGTSEQDTGDPAEPDTSSSPDQRPSNDEGDDDGDDETGTGAVWDETSEDVFLYVRQPGQLRAKKTLTGNVSAEVDGQLMSGIDARLFDATGARHRRGVLSLKTKLDLTFEIVLEDVFNRRPLSATHTMHFDEVVPDVQRIEDINAALRDRGFNVTSYPLRDDEAGLEWGIRAIRADGPDYIVLSIVVRGRRYRTTRRSGTAGWHRFTSEIDSGELRLAIHGRYPRHSRELTVEVNALRQALASRFRHMAAQR